MSEPTKILTHHQLAAILDYEFLAHNNREAVDNHDQALRELVRDLEAALLRVIDVAQDPSQHVSTGEFDAAMSVEALLARAKAATNG